MFFLVFLLQTSWGCYFRVFPVCSETSHNCSNLKCFKRKKKCYIAMPWFMYQYDFIILVRTSSNTRYINVTGFFHSFIIARTLFIVLRTFNLIYMIDWLIDWLIGYWLIDWLVGWLNGWLVCWLVGWLVIDWLVGWLVDWLIDSLAFM